jgi:SPP1 gp7 family putative phage head morphogenesis protein
VADRGTVLARRHALVRASSAVREKRRAARVKVPLAKPPHAAMVAYHVALRAVVARLRAVIDDVLVPELALYASPEPTVRTDSPRRPRDRGDWRRRAKRAAMEARLLEPAIHRTAVAVVTHAGSEFIRQVRRISEMTRSERAAHVSVNALGQEQMAPLVSAFARENVGLIQGFVDETLDQIGEHVATAVTRGVRVEALAAEIQERLGVSESRAALIARDQTLKLFGDATRQQQTSVGITEYDWATSKDERVRPMHADLDGTRHSWDDPPVVSEDGRTEHPGGDFQ